MIRAAASAALLTTLLGALALQTPARAARPTDIDLLAAEPFSVPAKDLQAAAASHEAPKDEDLEYLLDATHRECDADGRCVHVYRSIYRVLTTRGADWTKTLSARWKPGFDDKPELRARVIPADGRERTLDPRTLSEQPVAASDDVYTDYRMLTGPLPGVAPGAVVETLVKRVEIAPAFHSGRLFRFAQDVAHPTRRLAVEISFPTKTPLRWTHVGRPVARALKPRVTRRGGRVTLRVDGAPERRPWPLSDPPAQPSFGWTVVTTANSWGSVATEYAGILAKVLGEPGVKEAVDQLAADVIGDVNDVDAVVARIHAWMGEHLRYTGISLGDGAWVPTAPPAVARRNYGDCKDFATLFVALLRARGIAAEVALVRVDRTHDPLPDAPALGWFDHAIVFLPGPTPRWIDPTASQLAAGTLSASIAGRWALVARSGEEGLSPLPGVAADDRWTEVREVRLKREGPADIIERTDARGTSAGRLRGWYESTRADELPGFWSSYAEGPYGQTTAARRVGLEGYAPVVDPLHIELAFDGTENYGLSLGSGSFQASLGSVLGALPPALMDELKEATPDERAWKARWLERIVPLDLVRADDVVVEWRVTMPRGVTLASEPELPDGFSVGPVRFEASARRDGDVYVVRYALELSGSLLQPDEVVALHAALRKLAEQRTPVLTFVDEVSQLAEAGKAGEAVRLAYRLREEAPDDSVTWWWLYNSLLQVELIGAAGHVAEEMTARWPEDPETFIYLGWAKSFDGVGRRFHPGFDRAGAEAALRAGIAKDGDLEHGHRWLAELLMHRTDGSAELNLDRSVAKAALVELDWLAAHGDEELGLTRAIYLAIAGRHVDAKAAAAALPRSDFADRTLVATTLLAEGLPAALAQSDALGGTQAERAIRKARAAMDLVDYGHPARALEILDTIHDPNLSAAIGLMKAFYTRARDHAIPPKGECGVATRWWAEHVIEKKPPSEWPERYRSVPSVRKEVAAVAWGTDRLLKGLPNSGAPRSRLLASALDCRRVRRVGRTSLLELSWALGSSWPASRYFAIAVAGEGEGAAFEVWPATPTFLGIEALRALDEGREDEARALVAYAFEAGPTPSLAPVLAALNEPTSGSSVGDLDDEHIGALAAALAPIGGTATSALRRIDEVAGSGAAQALREALQEARIRALIAAGKFTAALDALKAAASGGSSVREPLFELADALQRAKPADLEALVDRAARLGGKRLDLRLRFLRYTATKHDLATTREEGERLLAEVGEVKFLTDGLRNSLAWLSLFDGRDPEAALARVEKVVERTSPVEHTRATILAALDRPKEAMVSLRSAVDLRETGVMSYDMVVLGRVAQSYGLVDLARWYYDQVTQEDDDSPQSSRQLAERWAAELPPPNPATTPR